MSAGSTKRQLAMFATPLAPRWNLVAADGRGLLTDRTDELIRKDAAAPQMTDRSTVQALNRVERADLRKRSRA